jgi:hypothetical protein
MSAISSYFSPANVYQAVDRNSFAQSSEAVGGTQQAFAETDEEASHNGQQQDESEEARLAEAVQTATPAAPSGNHYILNVTA